MGTKIHVCPGLKKRLVSALFPSIFREREGGGERREREREGGDKMRGSSNILLH